MKVGIIGGGPVAQSLGTGKHLDVYRQTRDAVVVQQLLGRLSGQADLRLPSRASPCECRAERELAAVRACVVDRAAS